MGIMGGETERAGPLLYSSEMHTTLSVRSPASIPSKFITLINEKR